MASTHTLETVSAKDASTSRVHVLLALSVIVSALSGCVTSPVESDTSVSDEGPRPSVEVIRSKLSRVGLELLSEHDAGIPARDAGRYVPCRVVAGTSAPLKPHPAGYLIVGFGGQLVEDAGKILRRLDRWKIGQTISLWVRRNPYLAAEPDWWEVSELPVTLR